MNDALAFTIELPDGKYASVNRTTRSWRDPRKSPIYVAVYGSVLEAAQREIARTGWTTAECECLATIMRVMPARWRADAGNLGKPEWDALTAAGVWTDDRLANPCLPWIRYDDEGPHRVTIVVMKLYEPAHVRIVNDAKTHEFRNSGKPGKVRTSPDSVSTIEPEIYRGGPIPPDKALVDGKLVDRDEALAEIRGMTKRRVS